MKLYVMLVACCLLFGPFVCADMIEMKDGTRIEGIILAENDDSLEIEIGKNEQGTIRRVLIIHSSEVKSWVADKEGRVQREQGEDVERLDGKAYVEQIIKNAEAEIDKGNYNTGILEFNKAADLITMNLDELEPQAKVEALELRVVALRMQLIALEGKSDALDKRRDSLEDDVESRRKVFERELDEYKDDKEDLERASEEQNMQLGKRHQQSDLVKREEALLRKQSFLNQQEAEMMKIIEANETEQLKTQTQMKLVEERVDQAENEARDAQRALRKR